MAGTGTNFECVHGLSVDVEDWFQVWAYSNQIPRTGWDRYPLRVADSTARLLDLFAAKNVTATFFILGWVAERCPQTVKRIVDEGHEIASHGYDHAKVFDLDERAFREDVLKAKSILEATSGQLVKGYRAPGFSIDHRTPFAYEVLAETGHIYSSSSHPIAHDHYGDPTAPLLPHKTMAGIVEMPVGVVPMFGRRISCAGGGWFRAMPYRLSRHLWQRLEGAGRQGVFYLHPWEVDPNQPKVPGAPLKARLRHRLNLQTMEKKLADLLTDFRWARMDEVLADEISDIPASPPGATV
ncbi:MAG: XrtA system polysaccharide deacetylase [Pseudomonadota bacterium]